MGAIETKVKSYLNTIKKENKQLNALLHLNPLVLEQAALLDKKQTKGKLYGKIIAIKSNINVQGLITNCASKVLQNYTAPYNASVIEKIKAEDGLIIGMCNMDEFAAGSSGENSAFGPTQNPIAAGLIPGGSSSGSAAAVAAGFCDIALGSDTGGSIRTPASHCAVVGVKPSYGLVSRYGLIDLSMSLDVIGPLARSVEDTALMLDVIRGKDEQDTTTFESSSLKLTKQTGLKIGVLKIKGVNKEIQQLIDAKVDEIAKKYKWKCSVATIDYIDLAVQTYYPLVYSEFFSATRRFDGRRYGHPIEEACGPEVLRRILGGAEITKAEHAGRFYHKALQVKQLIKEAFDKAFKTYDALILPTSPVLPWKIGQGLNMPLEQIYASDALTIPANLAEIPALSLPAGTIKGIPIGMQVFCAHNKDAQMLSIAQMIEQL